MEASNAGARPASRPVNVLSVKKNTVYTVRFLGQMDGILTHWPKKPGTPCPGEPYCSGSQHRVKTIWKGYSPIEAWDDHHRLWIPWVLEVTEGLEEALQGRVLRGEVWVVSRPQVDEKPAPVIGQYLEQLDPDSIRLDFPVRAVVCRMYGTTHIAWGIENPVPRKLLLEPSPGARPSSLYDVPEPEPNRITPADLAALRGSLRKAGLVNTKGETNGRHS